MSELATLARPYATAVFKRAKETASTQKWSDALAFLSLVIQDPQIVQAAANPKANKDAFTQALLDLCRENLDGEGENFVRLLAANHRLELIGIIYEQFEQFRADEEGYVVVNVGTAYPLAEDEREQLVNILKKELGKEPRLNVEVDARLIGGVFIQAGDRVIDASIRGQIQRLAKRLYN